MMSCRIHCKTLPTSLYCTISQRSGKEMLLARNVTMHERSELYSVLRPSVEGSTKGKNQGWRSPRGFFPRLIPTHEVGKTL